MIALPILDLWITSKYIEENSSPSLLHKSAP